MIQDNVRRIQDQIASICKRLGRNPQDITLVGVTKSASPENIKEVIAAGVSHIAENKVQDGLKKYSALQVAGKNVTKHMIGHLQTNKVKDALKIFDVIQSVDSIKLVQAIEKHASKIDHSVDILIQLNMSGEKQKFGLNPQDTFKVMEAILKLKYLRVKGLMTVAPLTEDQSVIKDCFRKLRQWRDKVAATFPGSSVIKMTYLSMGMSQDFLLALEEGSNMVRIGSAIFRESSNSSEAK